MSFKMTAALKKRLTFRRRVPVMHQMSATECGAACLAMILSYHGRDTRVVECRDRCNPGRDGLTARVIVNAARDYGLRAKAYSVEPQQLPQLTLPAIAHWNFDHFLVVERWSPRRVEVVDPAAGRRTLTGAEFDEGFTGVALAFEPGAHFERCERGRGVPWLKYLRGMLALPGAKAAFLHVLLASLLLQLLGLVLPLLTKLLVDTVIPFGLSGLMYALGAGLLLVVVSQSVLGFLRGSLLIHLRGRLDSQLMRNFFEHLLSLPFSFFQKRTSGDLLMRLSSNGFIRETLTNNTLSIIFDGSFVIIYLALLLYVSPAFGLIVAGLGALQVLVTVGTRRSVTRLMQRELVAKAAEQGYLTEAVSGVSMLKASGAEDRAFDRWVDLFTEQLNVSLERSRVSLRIENATSALRTLSPLLLLWFGALQVLGGGLSLGKMLAVNSLAAAFLAPISTLISNGQQLLLVGAHLERIGDVLEAEPEQSPREDRVALRLGGRVEVRDLSFQYDPNSPLVLRDISFAAEPGEKIALVGPSGSGKSTLAMLLLGLYEPTGGRITFDGVPLGKFNYRALRSQMGIVLQESALFSGSILQNITLNKPDATLEEAAEAAYLAGIHADITRMPMGYETFVSEGGTTLSGGQRQRLAIARALVHRPSMLVLDEATSHLDVQTEAVVERNLSALSCTRFVIAHRLSTVRNADRILVLSDGRLVEQGTHAELLAKDGYYAALVRTQPAGANEPRGEDLPPPVAAEGEGLLLVN